MKIGILTLPLVSNNGGILQAYALQTFLKENGNEAILLQRQSKLPLRYKVKRLILSRIYKAKYLSKVEYDRLNENPRIFIQQYIRPISEPIFTDKYLSRYVLKNNLDALIVGSDQVWRLEYCGKLMNAFFLDFKISSRVKKLSYAASFGIEDWQNDKKTTNIVRQSLKRFNAISVREDTGIDICKQKFDVNAVQLIDPTLLLDKNYYIKLIEEQKETKKNGKLFYYFLDENQDKIEMTNFCSKVLNMISFSVSSISDKERPKAEKVTNWLKGFMDAEFIITDSYHGCIFSIIFNKQFIAIGNKERGLARFLSLLKLLDLEDRMILRKQNLTIDLVTKLIDYKKINSTLDNQRKIAREFLDSNLS